MENHTHTGNFFMEIFKMVLSIYYRKIRIIKLSWVI